MATQEKKGNQNKKQQKDSIFVKELPYFVIGNILVKNSIKTELMLLDVSCQIHLLHDKNKQLDL